MSNPKRRPGKFVWFELASSDPKKAQAFYGEIFGWTVRPFPMGPSSYDMIYLGETMIGGYAEASGSPARWLASVSVDDVDAAVKAAVASGGKAIVAPHDLPNAGRGATLVDPQGAELRLLARLRDDPADVEHTPRGGWVWNELHTPDAKAALAFYESVIPFTHTSLDMGPGGAYHVLSSGGVGRGGVTQNLPAGVPPHWLPYLAVDDTDATAARAKTLGGKVLFGPEDIPGAGRAAVLQDPVGARVALLKPDPRQA